MFTIFKPHASLSRLAALAVAGLFAFSAATVSAQDTTEAVKTNLITKPISQDQRVTLKGNTHPLAIAKYDQGAAPGSMNTGRIMLVLKRSNTQELALKQYLGDLQNPNSPNYRKWVTPAQFGKQYGISDTDLTAVTTWLQSQGFKVEKVPQARNVVMFSGNVAQVQQAFQTSIHKYFVHGETHFANSSDPQIPAALAPVVAGVAQLNDFRPKAHIVRGRPGLFDTDSKTIKPNLNVDCGQNGCVPATTTVNGVFLTPADAATLYNTPNQTLNRNYSAVSATLGGKSYDGAGITIGIVGDSNVTASDVANYRAAFLPSAYSNNQPNIIVDGNDPGVNGDAGEALLDMEVAGGLAPGATVNFYTSADTDLQSGLFLAIYRALDDNAVSILNVSFGGCEANEGASGNQQILAAWEQAAAQGISVTASTGDSGSAGCDNPDSESVATQGLAVSGLSTTPYNIAVGGTDFGVPGTNLGNYITSTNSQQSYYGTLTGYVPETPWNNSTDANALISANTVFKDSQGNTNIVGAGGGISSESVCTAVDPAGNCVAFAGYSLPSFQTGVVKSYNVRAVPDVSLLAANGAYGAAWAVCADPVVNGGGSAPDCQNTNGALSSGATISGIGGTSAAAPAFAGMLALVAQSQGGARARLGQANYVLYNLASQSSLYGQIFHDVDSGNNAVYCTSGTPNCGSNSFLTGYQAVSGYDAASGLGSIDVSQLVAGWDSAKFTGTGTTITINGSQTVATATHGQPLNISVAVNPGAATGDVAVVNNNAGPSGAANALQNGGLLMNSGLNYLTLSSGKASGTSNQLPGGTYQVYARYGGDAKNASSTSTPVNVTIAPEASTLLFNVNVYDSSGNAYTGSTSSIPYGFFNFVVAQPVGNASTQNSDGSVNADGVATGSVTFTDNTSPLAKSLIGSNGVATYTNYQIPSQSLSVGQHSISASYSGDASFNGSSAAAQTLTVVKAGTQISATPSATSVGSTASVSVAITVNAGSIGTPPSGNVQLFNGSKAIGSATALTQGYDPKTGLTQSTAKITIAGNQITGSATSANADRFPGWPISGGAATLACVLFFAIPARRRSWRALVCMIAFAVVFSSVIGCGGGSSNNNGNGNGNGTGPATITAQYVGDGNYSASTSTAFTITVTQ